VTVASAAPAGDISACGSHSLPVNAYWFSSLLIKALPISLFAIYAD
jgi:hypothetical protein